MPILRFEIPASPQTLEWAALSKQMRIATDLRRLRTTENVDVLGRLYASLCLSPAEQMLVYGTDSLPVR